MRNIMNRIPVEPPLNRIPGLCQIKEQHSKDLKRLQHHELLEIRDRQSHLLASKKRLQQLPDKGKRIQESYDKVLAEIQRRNDVDETANLLGELNIASKGKVTLNNLEWLGRQNADDTSHMDDVLDSDDELEMDPLRVIAQGTMHERQVKVLPPPATLITADDLADIATFKPSPESPDSALADHSLSSKETSECVAAELMEIDAAVLVAKRAQEPDQHALYLIEKTEVQATAAEREKFKPFRTTVSNVHDPDKERGRKMGKYWEVTAATPPLIKHKEIQLVPLSESAHLQVDFMQKVKEQRLARQTKHRDAQVDYLIEGKQKPSEAVEVHDPTIDEKVVIGLTRTIFE